MRIAWNVVSFGCEASSVCDGSMFIHRIHHGEHTQAPDWAILHQSPSNPAAQRRNLRSIPPGMTNPLPESPTSNDLIERLRAIPLLSQIPLNEVEWLVEHGEVVRYDAGSLLTERGERVPGTIVVLKGRLATYTNQDGTWRKAVDWNEGDISGYLPYSRMDKARGNTYADEPSEVLMVPRAIAESLPVVCPVLTASLVHAMVDRTREFKYSDVQVEKFASLGKLAAGIAHELNNPTSAALRGAQLMTEALAESHASWRALESVHLRDEERATLEEVRTHCLAATRRVDVTPLEHAEREEAFADWLLDHGIDESFAADLVEAHVEVEPLTRLSDGMEGEKLSAAVRWVAAACALQGLAREIEHAMTRVHSLVTAVKGYTYMDRASAPMEVHVEVGLADTVAILAAKARDKGVALRIDVKGELPTVMGFGSELNQVWSNLIDNAIDAVGEEGRVTVTASHNSTSVSVRVLDNGPGIPKEIEHQIFDPFFTTKPVGEGTGLGLGIVQRLVAQNEGRLSVTSEPGRTEFCVTLPVWEG